METIRNILMNSTAEELSILAGYMIDMNEKEITASNDMTKRYQYVNELVSGFQRMGRNFFYSKMEYGDLVRKLAENMEVNIAKKSDVGIDFIELAIAKKYIIKNISNIPKEKKEELIKILGFNDSEVKPDDKNIMSRLADDIPDILAFRFTTWLTNATLQSFLGTEQEWECKGIIFFGKKDFREQVIYPMLYMTMLRYQYRYNQVPKCSACTAVIVPGAKFCNECGAKLV